MCLVTGIAGGLPSLSRSRSAASLGSIVAAITYQQSFWREENGYHRAEDQQLAPGIHVQWVPYPRPGSTDEHRPGPRLAYSLIPGNCYCDDDRTGGYGDQPALLLLQSHRFEGLSHASV